MEKRYYGTIVSSNLKHNFPSACACTIGIFLFTLIFFNITALHGSEAAQPIEFLLCWNGVVLLAPIFLPEQSADIRDVICSKKVDYIQICYIRLLYSVIAVVFFEALFIGMMRGCESDVGATHLFGGITTALFLGALAFAVSGICENTTVGYMAAMLYYLLNYGLKDKLGKFYLFSMSAGNFEDKEWLLAGAVVLIVMTFVVIKLRRKF